MSESPPEHFIQWLRSEATGRRFPTVVFVGDTDMVTMGWGSLTSTSGLEVVIVTCSSAEESDSALLEARVNRALGRDDLRDVPLLRVVDHDEGLIGLPFTEWLSRSRPSTLYYKDIYSAGKAVVDSDASLGKLPADSCKVSLFTTPDKSLERMRER